VVRIEQANAADVPALAELLSQLFSIEKDFRADAARQRRGIQALIEQPRNRAVVLVARDDDGTAIGMVSGQLVVSTAEGAPSAWIEDVVVAPGLRRLGIGRALLNAVLEWAATQGATRAQLLADQTNEAALAFYARLGWTRSSMVMLRIHQRVKPETGS
jgi:ribosomal protein S18 acetylase RimI-like enzyme